MTAMGHYLKSNHYQKNFRDNKKQIWYALIFICFLVMQLTACTEFVNKVKSLTGDEQAGSAATAGESTKPSPKIIMSKEKMTSRAIFEGMNKDPYVGFIRDKFSAALQLKDAPGIDLFCDKDEIEVYISKSYDAAENLRYVVLDFTHRGDFGESFTMLVDQSDVLFIMRESGFFTTGTEGFSQDRFYFFEGSPVWSLTKEVTAESRLQLDLRAELQKKPNEQHPGHPGTSSATYAFGKATIAWIEQDNRNLACSAYSTYLKATR
jgi:hypothetical protein